MKEYQCILSIMFILCNIAITVSDKEYVNTVYEVFSDEVLMRTEIVLAKYVWIYYMTVNMYDNITILNEYRYNELISSPITNISIQGNNVPVKISQERLTFQDGNYFNFTFSNIADEQYDNFLHEVISFPLKSSYKDNAFIYQLLKENVINELVMYFCSVKYYETDKEAGGIVYFGGINNTLIQDKYYTSIKPFRNANEWKSKMTKYVFHIVNNKQQSKEMEITLHNTNEVIFNIGDSYICVPPDVFDNLRKIYFKTAIDKNLCKVDNVEDNTIFSCQQEGLQYLGKIDFVIDYTVFSFTIYDLLEKHSKIYYDNENNGLQVDIYIKNNTLNNKWILGEVFFRNYITCLNFHKKEITFYSINPFSSIGKFSFQIKTLNLISTLTFISLIYLLIIKHILYKNKLSQYL